MLNPKHLSSSEIEKWFFNSIELWKIEMEAGILFRQFLTDTTSAKASTGCFESGVFKFKRTVTYVLKGETVLSLCSGEYIGRMQQHLCFR